MSTIDQQLARTAALANGHHIAKVSNRDIPVRHSVRPDVGREYLTIDCPNGWDDVKKISKKVINYDGRRFTFTGWNSDRNVCYFMRLIDDTTPTTATIE